MKRLKDHQTQKHDYNPSDEQIALWLRVFRGNTSAYAKRWEAIKDGERKVGYVTVREDLTSTVIKHHLTGNQPILVYVLLEDGKNVLFGAADLDNKPDKPEEAQSFDDALKIYNALRSLDITCFIARSTGKPSPFGYHVYVLIDRPYPAERIRAIFFCALEISGHMKEFREGGRKIQEIFPKQVGISDLGNGIRPPLSATGINIGRNCLVDENDIPYEDQWAALSEADENRNSPGKLDEIIKNHNLETYLTITRNSRPSRTNRNSNQNPRKSVQEKLPLEKLKLVLDKKNGCLALHDLATKSRTKTLGYDEGSALLSHITPFKGWRQWLTEKLKMKGWDDTPENKDLTDKFLSYRYSPFPCSAMQERSLCPFKNSQTCFLRKFKNGELVEPSPHRFAYGAKHRRNLTLRSEDVDGL